MTSSRILVRRRLLMSMRLSAVLLVAFLFAALTYRIVHGVSGARLTRAINAHRSPPAPNIELSVIWPQAETWPPRLRASVNRGTFRLRDLRGYPVVLNFWASWCSPCRHEAAILASAAEARRGRVVFLGVDVNDLTTDARRFLRKQQIPYVAVRSGGSIADRFGLIGLPETLYVDRRGDIRDVTRGELSAATLNRALALASQN